MIAGWLADWLRLSYLLQRALERTRKEHKWRDTEWHDEAWEKFQATACYCLTLAFKFWSALQQYHTHSLTLLLHSWHDGAAILFTRRLDWVAAYYVCLGRTRPRLRSNSLTFGSEKWINILLFQRIIEIILGVDKQCKLARKRYIRKLN